MLIAYLLLLTVYFCTNEGGVIPKDTQKTPVILGKSIETNDMIYV